MGKIRNYSVSKKTSIICRCHLKPVYVCGIRLRLRNGKYRCVNPRPLCVHTQNCSQRAAERKAMLAYRDGQRSARVALG